MLNAQFEIIRIARCQLESRDESHMTRRHTEPTSFPVNSYVLVDYIDGPPSTLRTPLEGPFRVVSSVDGKYTL